MFYEVFVGLRHLRPKKKFISLFTLLAIAGVALGVGALIIVLAVMSGFEEDLKEKILGTSAHLLILGQEKISEYQRIIERIRSLEGVEAVSPFIQAQAILVSQEETFGVTLKGIDPELERGVSDIQKKVVSGSDTLQRDQELLIGSELASYLGIGINSPVLVISARRNSGRFNIGIPPNFSYFKVAGIFKSGMYQYDSTLACLNLKAAQRLLGLGDMVDGVAVRLKDLYKASAIKDKVRALFASQYEVKTWMEMNRSLFEALCLEKRVMFVILILIVFVAGLGITNTLMMTVLQKRKEIGILLSIGATRGGIIRTFIFEGVVIGLFGTLIGLFLGLGTCWVLGRLDLIQLPQNVYYIDYLPVKVKILDVLFITFSAITLSVLAAIYPAIRAASLDPVEVIRYE